MSFTYSHTFTLPATPDRVFRALVEPDELTRWFAEGALVEPRMGGVYRFWGRHTLGTPPEDAARQTITRFEPGSLLGYSWPIDEVESDVTMALALHEMGATLTITHRVYGDLNVPRQPELIEDHWRVAINNLSAHLAGTPAVRMPDYFARRD